MPFWLEQTLLLVLQKRIYGQETFAKEQKIDRRTDIRYRIWKPFRSNLNFPKQEKNAGEMQEMEGLFCSLAYSKKSLVKLRWKCQEF